MNNSNHFAITIGDIYRDKDPRMSDRLVKVVSEDGRYAYVIRCTEGGEEIGRRTRISLAGLESRFERAGGSTVRADLERAVLAAAKKWRKAEMELEQTRRDDPYRVFFAGADDEVSRARTALESLRKSVDALRPEPAAEEV